MKSFLIDIIDALMRISTLLPYLLYLIESRIFGRRRAIGAVSELLSLIPGVFGELTRRGFLQWLTGQQLKSCCISFGTLFSDPLVRIDNGVYIGKRCDIGYVHIHADCVIGSNVHMLSGLKQHGIEKNDVAISDQPGVFSQVKIGSGCWIGNNSVIGADIGANSVVGCGSVVLAPVPEFAIVAGNPAEFIRSRKEVKP